MNEYQTQLEYQLVTPDRSKLYEFIGDSFRRVSLGYMGVLFLGLLASSTVYFITKNATYGAIWPNQTVYYFILICHVLFRIKRGRANILSPDILFLILYTIVHLGYVSLYSLNLAPQSEKIFYYETSLPLSMYVVNLGLLGFLFGYEIMGLRAPIVTQWPTIIRPSWQWETFGIFLMGLSLAVHFVGLTLLGWDTILRYGYQSIQQLDKFTNYFTSLLVQYSTLLMAVAITIYVIASALRHGKLFKSKIAMALTIFFLVVVTLEGSRTAMMQFGLPLLLVQHFFVKRIKTRYLIVMFLLTMALFAALAVVRASAFQVGKMVQEYQYQRQTGEVGWQAPFVELGGSFLVVNIVTQDVPVYEPYWLGASWRDAAIHIIPFLQRWWVTTGYAKYAPSQWITFTYFGRQAAGRGFTVTAEGFLNFGFPGVFIELMLVGMFIRWLMIFFGRHPSALRAIIMLACLGRAVLLTRNHSNGLLAPCAQIFVLAWLLNMFLGNEPYTDEIEMNDYNEPYLQG